jgi:hypothetical protein
MSEGREPCDHLVDYASQTPPVHSFSMTLLFYHLRSQVLGSPTHRHRFLVLVDESFREAKVCEFDVTYSIQQDIFWFETELSNRYSR